MKRVKFRLLLWAVLLLTGWTSASATEFISKDFMLGCDPNEKTAKEYLTSAGYTVISGDLNASCGENTNYIFLGIKKTTDASQAVTNMVIWSGGDAPSSFTHDNKTYYKITKCAGYNTNYGDLNKGVGGEFLYLYYTTDGNTKSGTSLLTGISVEIFGSSQSNSNYVDYAGNSGGKDCNAGAGGDYIYIKMTKGHKHTTSCRAISPFKHEHYCPGCGYRYRTENHNMVNGSCSKCGYNEATAPLTFIAKKAGSTVKFHKESSPYSADMQYTRDYVTWYSYTLGKTIELNKVNDFVAFRSSATRNQFSKDNDNYYHYQLTGSVAATGTVMTLFSPKGTRTTVSQYALNKLFYNQTALISAPYLPATSLGSNCYESMFEGCTGLTSARTLPATTLSSNCYKGMFKGCTNLTSAPELKATTLAQNCCTSMFEGCIKLTNAPELKATTLASNCYEGMFKGCIKLTSAPALPANTMKSYCYYNMFNGCTSLTNAPTLSAASLAENCYESMFEGCTSLVNAPALSAYTLANGCYRSMFKGCQKLKQCPTLRATSLATDCYHSMFEGCIALTNASELPATVLKENCYNSMFRNCTGLTSAPYMPATTLVTGCYNKMFEGCSDLSKVRAYFGSWVNGATTDWLKDVAQNGHFYSTPTLPLTRGTSYIPEGWDAPECDYLRFTANVANSTISISQEDDYWELEYSRDGINWTNYETDEVITLSEAGDQVFLRNKTVVEDYLEVEESSHIEEHHHIHLTGSVAASGNIMYLLDHDGEKRTVSYEGFYGLFQGESALTSAPTLTATTLGVDAYAYMFFECPNLHEVEVAFSAWPENATKQWLTGAASQGTFICPPSLPRTRGEHYIPEGWNVPEYLTLTAKKTGATVRLHKSGSPADISLQYSTDGVNWRGYTIDESITLANVNDYVCFRATSTNSTFSTGDCHYYIFELGDSIAASGNVMSLLDKTCQQTSVPERAFCKLFMNQPKLTSAPFLPATSLAYSCYSNMFEGCTGLTSAPALPATSLAYGCYSNMFKGCTGLTAVPTLPATSLADYCYSNMFEGCSNLNEVNVAFTSWSNSATTNWLNGVASTGTFTCPSSLPRNRGIDYIPEGWDAPEYLTLTAQKAGATVQLTKNGSPASVSLQYSTRYSNWSDYTIGNVITLADSADYVRFRATSTNSRFSTIANNYYMFVLGDSIAASGNVMSLLDKTCKKTSVAEYAFYNLFGGQKHLTSAPALSATSLATFCYYDMFYGCTGLTSAPTLPATELASDCYRSMFEGCTSLTDAPVLPATTLTQYCYSEMFKGCTSLTSAPALPATTLSSGCYMSMFRGCTRLTSAPTLPATTLIYGCYHGMFKGCTNLRNVDVAFTSWISGATTDWLDGVAAEGTFICPPSLPRTRGTSYIPEGWEAISPEYLTLTAKKAGATVKLTKNGSPASVSLQYSTRYSNWSDYAIGSTITLTNVNDYVRFRATETNSRFSTGSFNYYQFVLGDSIAASGNIMSLLDKTCKQTSVSEYTFYNLFGGQTSLTQAPELPATTLANGCYYRMFFGCTGLINAPALPATTLANYCYEQMFYYCIGLTQAPELPATNLADYCYQEMFNECSRLTNAPELPATKLANYCYQEMFKGCSRLTNAPELPATALTTSCYASMFAGCVGLTQAPELPATKLADYCYTSMFEGCTNLTQTPVLHAATLTESCYNKMFSGCINLNKVIVNFSDAKYFNLNAEEANATIGCSEFEVESPTFEWLADVASTGTFVCPSTMDITKLYRGSNNIPSGWTIEPFLTEVKLNSKGYATYSASVNMVTNEKEKAFACKVEGDEIHCSAIDSIPAGTGALLVGDAEETVRLHMVLDAPAVENNDLRATTSDSLYVERIPNEGFNYALNGSKFLRYTGATFAANKAYFNLSAAITASAAELRLVFDDLIAEEDETTSINSISTDDADQTPAFSLQGQRVTSDAKGLQVRNGHVIFKK